MLRYFDIHSHLNFPDFDEDRDAIIARMKEEGIATIVIGTETKTSEEAVALARGHTHIFATIGIHPTHDGDFDEGVFARLADNSKVVAIGECGLDYFREQGTENKERQEKLFRAHIEFASARQLPLMIHGRPRKGTMDAYEDILMVLKEYPGIRGNVHFFAGTPDIAKRFLDIGFSLSFDGPITFTDEYDEVIKMVPGDMLMAETDAPYAAPAPYRGKRNEPGYVTCIADRLAEVRGEEKEALREQLVQNAIRIFGLEEKIKDI